MIKRHVPLQRHTPLKRGSLSPLKRTRLKKISASRSSERAEYNRRKAAYLIAHPLDQIAIAIYGLDETNLVLQFVGKGWRAIDAFSHTHGAVRIYPANQIHHRNKSRKGRLNDERWWMATVLKSHEYVETHKDWAREQGFLLPIQADSEGRWGLGNQALATPGLMESKIVV